MSRVLCNLTRLHVHEITVGKQATNDNSGEYLHLPLDPGSQNYCPNGLPGLEGEVDSNRFATTRPEPPEPSRIANVSLRTGNRVSSTSGSVMRVFVM